jgi:hypothetical protein
VLTVVLLLSACEAQPSIELHPASPVPHVVLDANACAHIAQDIGYLTQSANECPPNQERNRTAAVINRLLEDCETKMFSGDTQNSIIYGMHQFIRSYKSSVMVACTDQDFNR